MSVKFSIPSQSPSPPSSSSPRRKRRCSQDQNKHARVYSYSEMCVLQHIPCPLLHAFFSPWLIYSATLLPASRHLLNHFPLKVIFCPPPAGQDHMEMRFPLKSWQNKDYFLFRLSVEENHCMIFSKGAFGGKCDCFKPDSNQQLPVTDLVMINGNYTDFAHTHAHTHTFWISSNLILPLYKKVLLRKWLSDLWQISEVAG